jgi:hypothetical protein
MSQASELLNSLTETTPDEIVTGSNIVIGRDRFLVVPESLKKLGVQFDHDVETVTFDCPRFWDEWDLSRMKIYVNYMRVDGGLGSCLCKNIVVDSEDSEIVHFDWTVSGNVTVVEGGLSVLVCAKAVDSDGLEKTHWNSELNTDMYISKGLRCQETILRRYPDIITQLLLRMEHAEAEVTPDAIRTRINECLATENTTRETIAAVAKAYLEEDVVLDEVTRDNVDRYLTENPVPETRAELALRTLGYELGEGDKDVDTRLNETENKQTETDGYLRLINRQVALAEKTLGYSKKNLFGGAVFANKLVEVAGATKDETAGIISYTAANISEKVLFNNFKSETQYTFIVYGHKTTSSTSVHTNLRVRYTDGTYDDLNFQTAGAESYAMVVTDSEKTVQKFYGINMSGTIELYYDKCGVFEGVLTVNDFEPYKPSVDERLNALVKIVLVDALPENPDPNTLYVIPE